MATTIRKLFAVILLLALQAGHFEFVAADENSIQLKELLTISQPIFEQEKPFKFGVNEVMWVNNDLIVYSGRSDFIKCYDIAKQSEVWKVNTGREIRSIACEKESVFTLLDPPPKLLGNNFVSFRLSDGKMRELTDLNSMFDSKLQFPYHVAANPQTRIAAIAYSGEDRKYGVVVLDLSNNAILSKIGFKDSLTEVKLFNQGTQLLTRTSTSNIKIEDTASAKVWYEQRNNLIAAADATQFCDIEYDGKSRLWYIVGHGWAANDLRCYEFRKAKPFRQLENFEPDRPHSYYGPQKITIDFKSNIIFAICSTGNSFYNLEVMDFDQKRLTSVLDVSKLPVNQISLSPNQERLALACQDSTVRIFQIIKRPSSKE